MEESDELRDVGVSIARGGYIVYAYDVVNDEIVPVRHVTANLDVAIEIVRRTALELQAAEELAVPKGARKNG